MQLLWDKYRNILLVEERDISKNSGNKIRILRENNGQLILDHIAHVSGKNLYFGAWKQMTIKYMAAYNEINHYLSLYQIY